MLIINQDVNAVFVVSPRLMLLSRIISVLLYFKNVFKVEYEHQEFVKPSCHFAYVL